MNVLARIQTVLKTLLGPWRHSNEELLEEVRQAVRDANASKMAVTRLRSELRGEVEAGEDVEKYRKVMPGPTPRPIPQPAATDYKKGQSLARILEKGR